MFFSNCFGIDDFVEECKKANQRWVYWVLTKIKRHISGNWQFEARFESHFFFLVFCADLIWFRFWVTPRLLSLQLKRPSRLIIERHNTLIFSNLIYLRGRKALRGRLMPVTYNFFQRFGKERAQLLLLGPQLLQKAWRHLLLKLRVNSRVLTYTSLSSSNQGSPTAATARKPLIDLDEIGSVSDFPLN